MWSVSKPSTPLRRVPRTGAREGNFEHVRGALRGGYAGGYRLRSESEILKHLGDLEEELWLYDGVLRELDAVRADRQ